MNPRIRFLAFLLLWPLAASAQSPDHSRSFTPSYTSKAETLFSLMDQSQTGLVVDNPYDDPKMWGQRYREFMGGGMGSGVAAGDFDNDGRVDLYVSTKTKPGRLFRNVGNWKFKDVTDEAGLSEEGSFLGWISQAVSSDEEVIWRQGAVFADVNNDGWMDLFVCRNNATNLLYMNQGNGSFEEEGEKRGLGIVDGSVVGSFVDYDRDGWLDVLILTNQVEGNEPGGREDRLFHNRGNGTFVETTEPAGISGPTFGHAATWFDYNEDKWPDLYLANDFSGHDYLYRNNGDGSFTNVLDEVVPHTPYSSMGVDSADINNDGHIDLLVSDMATTSREKNQRGLAASRGDVLTAGTTEGVAPQYTRNALLLNSGLGVFGEAAAWAGVDATDWTWSVRFEDFDNDGWIDLHVTNGMVREANNSDLLARMMKALSDMQRIAVIHRAPPLNESNLAYRNLEGRGFADVTENWGLTDVGVSFGAATADFDQDGDLDIAYLDYNGGLKVFRNNASGSNSIQIRLQGKKSNRFGVGAVVRLESPSAGLQSRTFTVARGYAAGSELVAHFGLGSDEEASRLIVEWPSGKEQVFTGIVANRAYLIREEETAAIPTSSIPVTALFSDQSKQLKLQISDASELTIPDKEQAFLPFRTDRNGPSLTIADLDGDGQDELFLGSTTGSPARILDGNDGTYQSKTSTSSNENGPTLAFDADSDGDRDLLLTQASANASNWPHGFQPKFLENDGQGNFTPTDWLPSLAVNTGAAVAADIDGDGDLDLFLGGRSIPVRYPALPQSFLLINENGRFVERTQTLAPKLARVGLTKGALFRDVDRDGFPDLVLSLEWDYVRIFRNKEGKGFEDRTSEFGFQSGGRGWWNGIVAADFNGDGQMDFAVGNLGLNTTYEATPEYPATLFYGDFAQNGTKLIAEAIYDNRELYPLRSRVDIGSKLPTVLRHFPKNDDFAKAKFTEVYNPAALEKADRFEADTFQSGVFLSQAEGHYAFSALPPEAQIGPVIGWVACDLDGDGNTDLFGTQNTDTAIPRFHGGLGLVLLGDGKGSFRFLRPKASGVALPGNGRSIGIIDANTDSKPDIFLTRHGGDSVAYLNRSETSNWMRIKIRGPAGNLDSTGARIELTFSDGSRSFHERGLGGGWQSQDTTDIFVSQSEVRALTRATLVGPNGIVRNFNPPQAPVWIINYP